MGPREPPRGIDRLSDRSRAGLNIHDAARYGRGEFIEAASEQDPGVLNSLEELSGDTLLHAATSEARVEVVRYLMDQGAGPTALNAENVTPMNIAENGTVGSDYIPIRRHRFQALLRLLGGQGSEQVLLDDVEALCEAADVSDVSTVRGRLVENADLASRKDERGMVALHYAAWHGHKEMARLLLDHGAGIEVVDGQGYGSVISWARENGREELVDFLLEEGATISVRQAAGYGRLLLVKRMLEADPSLIDHDDGLGTERLFTRRLRGATFRWCSTSWHKEPMRIARHCIET